MHRISPVYYLVSGSGATAKQLQAVDRSLFRDEIQTQMVDEEGVAPNAFLVLGSEFCKSGRKTIEFDPLVLA